MSFEFSDSDFINCELLTFDTLAHWPKAKTLKTENWDLWDTHFFFLPTILLSIYTELSYGWVAFACELALPLLSRRLGKGCVNNTIHLLRSFRILFFKIFWKLKFWVGQKSSRNLIFMSLTWKDSIRDIRDMPKTKRQTSKR